MPCSEFLRIGVKSALRSVFRNEGTGVSAFNADARFGKNDEFTLSPSYPVSHSRKVLETESPINRDRPKQNLSSNDPPRVIAR